MDIVSSEATVRWMPLESESDDLCWKLSDSGICGGEDDRGTKTHRRDRNSRSQQNAQ